MLRTRMASEAIRMRPMDQGDSYSVDEEVLPLIDNEENEVYLHSSENKADLI